jgi:hypothetical protein
MHRETCSIVSLKDNPDQWLAKKPFIEEMRSLIGGAVKY